MYKLPVVGLVTAVLVWAQSPIPKLPPGVYTNKYSPLMGSMPGSTRAEAIREAASSLVDFNTMGMVVQTRRMNKLDPNSLDVVIYLDPRAIHFERNGDQMNGKVDIFFVQKDDRGDQFNGKDDLITLNLTPDNYRKAMTSGLSYHQTISLSSEATRLRIVARDNASGTLGSLTVPLSVEVPTEPQPKQINSTPNSEDVSTNVSKTETPQPPNVQQPPVESPGLDVTMKFIEDKLRLIERINSIAYIHDNALGRDWITKFTQEVTNVRVDPTTCRIEFHLRLTKDAKLTEDTEYSVLLKDVHEVVFYNREQDLKELDAKAGHPEYTSRVDPPVFEVRIKSKAAQAEFELYDGALANRIVTAMQHAVALCGGGDKEPF